MPSLVPQHDSNRYASWLQIAHIFAWSWLNIHFHFRIKFVPSSDPRESIHYLGSVLGQEMVEFAKNQINALSSLIRHTKIQSLPFDAKGNLLLNLLVFPVRLNAPHMLHDVILSMIPLSLLQVCPLPLKLRPSFQVLGIHRTTLTCIFCCC